MTFDVEFYLSSEVAQVGTNLDKERNRQWRESEKMYDPTFYFPLPQLVSLAVSHQTILK